MKIPIIDESNLLNPVEENIPIKENDKKSDTPTTKSKSIKVGAVVGIIILIIVVISVTIYSYGKIKKI